MNESRKDRFPDLILHDFAIFFNKMNKLKGFVVKLSTSHLCGFLYPVSSTQLYFINQAFILFKGCAKTPRNYHAPPPKDKFLYNFGLVELLIKSENYGI